MVRPGVPTTGQLISVKTKLLLCLGALYTVSPRAEAEDLHSVGTVQSVALKSGEQMAMWKVLVSSTPVLIAGFDNHLGGLDCQNYSGKYEVWIGTSPQIVPWGSAVYPIERREGFYTTNGAALYGVIASTETAAVYCRKEY